MQVLDRKLLREFWDMRMQALAIALVIVGGVSIYVMSLSTLDSLYQTRETYYRSNHFAEVFASLTRAPNALEERIRNLPGVNQVETRVIAYVNLDVPGFTDPVSAHLLSLPDNSPGRLNQILLKEGRLLAPGQSNEVIVCTDFADAHKLTLGDSLSATINGRRKTLTIVGIATSPEYIYQLAPGSMFPDPLRYGVMWIAHKPLGMAYDLDGAFNTISLTLAKGSNAQTVIDQLDVLLKPYGGAGAYARKDQFSNRFLTEELKQLKSIATIFPVIFFGVAAFLLNVVISRLISLQREQIAALKAFGYSNLAVGFQYLKLVFLVVGVGVALGVGVGIWMGQGMSHLYQTFYSLPYMVFVLKPAVIVSATLISLLVALAGTLYAVYGAVRLPPAQAMRPEQPAIYHTTLIERLGLEKHVSQPTRMILRHIERRPLKSLLTLIGISLSCGTLMTGGFQESAINRIVDVQFGLIQSHDLTAIYTQPASKRSLNSLKSLEGVNYAEGFRSVPVRLSFEHRSYRTSMTGVDHNGQLMRLLDTDLKRIPLPQEGVVITDYLAREFGIKPGDFLTVEVLDGHRQTLQVPVVGTTREYLGVNAYMRREALNRLLKEGDVISGAWMSTDPLQQQNVYLALKEMPRIAGVVVRSEAIKAFDDTLAETILVFTLISTLLGASIAFGVVYNSMKIALSERNRELASLRVLGFEKREVAYILLGEMALITLVAIPVGLLFGYGLCAMMALQFQSDLYRTPLYLGPDVFAFAALIIVVSALASGALIWREMEKLDMVAVLKTKE